MAALVLPQRSFYDWTCEPGKGFALRADPSLFLREPVLELAGEVPTPNAEEDPYDDPLDAYEY